MAFYVSQVLYYDEFTGTGGAGVSYLNANVGNKITAKIWGYFYLSYLGKSLVFDSSTKTISNNDPSDNSSFLDDGIISGKGLSAGRTIEVEGSGSNDGTYTVVSVTRTTIVVAESLIDETIDDIDIFDDTQVEAVDFYSNLIENKDSESYLSTFDTNAIQRFSVDGLDPMVSTPINCLVTSNSFGWVTQNIVDPITGETDDVTIKGNDWPSHQQRYIIQHTFIVTPILKSGQYNDFVAGRAPSYFTGANALKYIFRVDGKFDFSDPDVAHSGGLTTTNGASCWFDQNNIRSRAEYYFDSISYDSGNLDSLDIDKIVDVSITIKSRSGNFDATDTYFALDFLWFPLNESAYINTPTKTMYENLLHDRRYMRINTGANGENYGTDYQVIKQIVPVYVDANTIRIEFKVDFSDAIKTKLKALDRSDRNFIFIVTTQDEAITTTKQVDRVAILCELNKIEYDQSDTELIEAVDNIRIYHFPQVNVHPFTSVAGWEGDPVRIEFPFRLKTDSIDDVTPTIIRSGFQIVATKSGRADFVLEEKIFDTSLVRKLDGVQTIDISESRNFSDLPDVFNICSIARDSSFDDLSSGSGDPTLSGFLTVYSMVLRYDFWASLVADNERNKYDLFKDIESPTNAWNTLQNDGWSLQVRFLVEVDGYEGYRETFDQYWNIDCKYLGESADIGPVIKSTVEYSDPIENIITNAIIRNGKTKIVRTYTGDFSSIPSGYNSLFGYIFADYEGSTGSQNRRFISTEFNVEDSPFTATDEDVTADATWCSNGLRINIYGTSSVTLETIYDDAFGNITDYELLLPRLGYMYGCFILTEDDEYMLSEDGQRLLMEECNS